MCELIVLHEKEVAKMKTIYIPVGGRLGNQLFYYGFGRWLQIKYFPDYKLCFDFSAVLKQGKHYRYDTNGWENSLKYFNVQPYEEYPYNLVVYREGNLYQKLLAFLMKIFMRNRKLNENTIKFCAENGIIFNDRPQLDKIYHFDRNWNRDIFVRGVLESDYYVNQIRDELLEEIVPHYERKKENRDLYNIIENTESVCVSIRRGDYVLNPDLQYKFNICNKEYFDKAIEKIKENVKNPVLFFFSDDIAWCKEQFARNIGVPIYFESGNDDLSEKLRLMSACKHFIISNSTFSWWAQWLGTDDDKIVISPCKWYRDKNSYLLLDEFVKIDVE